MDRLLYLTLLYDFYGELLTARQKEMFEMYFLNDLSMQEIGEQFDVSRQAVNDLLKRTEKILADYEKKLRLVDEHIRNKRKMDEIIARIDALLDGESDPRGELRRIKQALDEISR